MRVRSTTSRRHPSRTCSWRSSTKRRCTSRTPVDGGSHERRAAPRSTGSSTGCGRRRTSVDARTGLTRRCQTVGATVRINREEHAMSRLGSWTPSTLEERLDRIESLADIRQLPYRYALALDSRDMDALVALFVPDVQVGREQRGRAALKDWFTATMRKPRTSIHFIGNHIVDFDDAGHAHGIVYCRDELERPGLD